MLRVNHFPLKSELRVARSCYRHSNARGYCGYLRSAGYDATEEAGQVIVYHAAGIEPDDRRKPVVSYYPCRRSAELSTRLHRSKLGYVSHSRRDQTWSVNPAAIAGVR